MASALLAVDLVLVAAVVLVILAKVGEGSWDDTPRRDCLESKELCFSYAYYLRQRAAMVNIYGRTIPHTLALISSMFTAFAPALWFFKPIECFNL
ncbi:hypothetical protein BC939DRAFT_463093 [Gamsiella multidivaricata]|nr:hypothetical protein BC939DRAFT_463093 [Gamsiella multidivaricata]